jgi:hypothetical protein
MSLYKELREISHKCGNHKSFLGRIGPRLLSGELCIVCGRVADNKDPQCLGRLRVASDVIAPGTAI